MSVFPELLEKKTLAGKELMRNLPYSTSPVPFEAALFGLGGNAKIKKKKGEKLTVNP